MHNPHRPDEFEWAAGRRFYLGSFLFVLGLVAMYCAYRVDSIVGYRSSTANFLPFCLFAVLGAAALTLGFCLALSGVSRTWHDYLFAALNMEHEIIDHPLDLKNWRCHPLGVVLMYIMAYFPVPLKLMHLGKRRRVAKRFQAAERMAHKPKFRTDIDRRAGCINGVSHAEVADGYFRAGSVTHLSPRGSRMVPNTGHGHSVKISRNWDL